MKPTLRLTDRDKRTLRMAGVLIAVYLILFFGLRTYKYLETQRRDYERLTREARRLRQELLPYENQALLLEKLQENFRMDVTKLSAVSLVGQASAAIQKAAQAGGVRLGPIRETAGSPSGKERAAMQIEAVGQVPSIMLLLHQLPSLGFPLIVDSVQLTPDPRQPGMVKLTLHLVVLDFEQWKQEARRNV